jgi:phosphatidylglycerophosphate synthase
MSTLARISVPRPDISLRVRLWGCYAVVALIWATAVTLRMGAQSDTSFPFAAALWTAWLPLADVISVRLRRIARGRDFFGTDYRHLHHYMLAIGWGRAATICTLVAICSVIALGSYVAWSLEVPGPALFVAAIVAFAGFHAWMTSRWKRLAGFCVVMTQ